MVEIRSFYRNQLISPLKSVKSVSFSESFDVVYSHYLGHQADWNSRHMIGIMQ